MVLVQNKYKNTLIGVLRTQITFITHASHSCYVTLRVHVIRLNSGNLGPQKIDSGVFINIYQTWGQIQKYLYLKVFKYIFKSICICI